MLKKIRKLNSAGDTILEVLISVAVLSLILTTSFTLANKSSQANRQAGERGEATKWAQSEIEKLKYFLSEGTAPSTGTYFCVDAPAVGPPTAIGLLAIDLNTNNSGINAKCKHGTDQRYATFIKREVNTYTVFVRWDAVTGSGVDKIDLIHRVYPETVVALAGITNNAVTTGVPPISPPPPVVSIPPPPTVPLLDVKLTNKGPSSISTGSSFSTEWSSTGASSCVGESSPVDSLWNTPKSIAGGNGNTSGLNVVGNHTYTVSCSNTAGTTKKASFVGTVTYESLIIPRLFSNCFTTGSSSLPEPFGCIRLPGGPVAMHNNTSLEYRFMRNIAGPVTAKLEIKYQQYANDSTLPPLGYNYEVRYWVDGEPGSLASLPVDHRTSGAYIERTAVLDVQIPANTTGSLNLWWRNNFNFGGIDSDFQINSIRLYAP